MRHRAVAPRRPRRLLGSNLAAFSSIVDAADVDHSHTAALQAAQDGL